MSVVTFGNERIRLLPELSRATAAVDGREGYPILLQVSWAPPQEQPREHTTLTVVPLLTLSGDTDWMLTFSISAERKKNAHIHVLTRPLEQN